MRKLGDVIAAYQLNAAMLRMNEQQMMAYITENEDITEEEFLRIIKSINRDKDPSNDGILVDSLN